MALVVPVGWAESLLYYTTIRLVGFALLLQLHEPILAPFSNPIDRCRKCHDNMLPSAKLTILLSDSKFASANRIECFSVDFRPRIEQSLVLVENWLLENSARLATGYTFQKSAPADWVENWLICLQYFSSSLGLLLGILVPCETAAIVFYQRLVVTYVLCIQRSTVRK